MKRCYIITIETKNKGYPAHFIETALNSALFILGFKFINIHVEEPDMRIDIDSKDLISKE